jgi:hypothetical protein
MKTTGFRSALLIGVLLFLIFACKKENNSDQNISDLDEIKALIDQAGSEWDNQEVYADDDSQTLYMLLDGIPADFLVDETFLDEHPQGISGKDSTEVRLILKKSFIRCLRGLALSDSQVHVVKRYLNKYDACTEHAVQRAKAIYQKLKDQYHIKYKRLWNAFQNGTITKEEFLKKVRELKIAFKKELNSLHLKEKLHEALKQCLHTFFSELKGVLTVRQWKAFIECYRTKTF